MTKKQKDKILFIWDKIKTAPSDSKYWVIMGLAICSAILNYYGNSILRFIIIGIFIFELAKLLYYEFSNQDKLELKDIRRAETIYQLLEEQEDDD